MTTVNWTGRSGNNYEFELHVLHTEFKPLPGVYVLCRPGRPGFMEALYVGETQSFFDRLNTGLVHHDGYKRAAAMSVTHIAVMVVADATLRLRVETDLRHSLNPVCNSQPIRAIRMGV